MDESGKDAGLQLTLRERLGYFNSKLAFIML